MSVWNTNHCWQKMKMLPFEAPSIFEQLPRILFRMPRVVLNQKSKFETDDLFKKLSRECEVKFTGYNKENKNHNENQYIFIKALETGMVDVVFDKTGTAFHLLIPNGRNGFDAFGDGYDFQREPGKVHIQSSLIMNGVCVRWRGWIDLQRLDGVACLEFDEERAAIEDAMLREQIKRYDAFLNKEMEEKNRLYKETANSQLCKLYSQ